MVRENALRSVLYKIFITERKVFLLFSLGVLAYGLFLLNKYFSVREYSHFWWKCWLLSIAFLVITFSSISPATFLSIHKKATRFFKEFFRLHFQKIGYLVAFLLIIVLGISFRLYRLDYLPWGLDGLHGDTAIVSLYAFRILEGIPYTPLGCTVTLHDTLPYYYIALFFSLFGSKLFILRFAALSIGIINVVLIYFVVKSITKSIFVSLSGMALLAFSAVDTVLNYGALECMISTPIHLVSFLLVSLALNSTRSIYFVAAGLCFGLELSSSKYFMPLAPCIILIFIHHAVFNRQQWKSLVKSMAFFSLATFYAISPKLMNLTYYHTEYFNRVWFVTTVGTAFEHEGIIEDIYRILSKMKPTFTLLFSSTTTADKWFIGDNPIIDQFILPLFVIGIICAIVRIKDIKYFFLLSYLVFSILLNTLSYPADYRFIIFMPLLYIMASLTLNLTNLVSRFKKALYIPVGISLFIIILFNIKIYYEGMGVNPTKSQYNVKSVTLGKYLSENPPKNKTYVCLNHPGWETVFFNYYNKETVDYTKLTHELPLEWDPQLCSDIWYYKILVNLYKIINENKHSEENLFLIFDDAPCNEEAVSRLESIFKKSRSILPIYSKSYEGDIVYFMFELRKDEIMRAERNDIFPPYGNKIHPALKEFPNDEFVGGIVGKYYEGVDLTKLVFTRVDKEIDFNWGIDRPQPSLYVDNFNIFTANLPATLLPRPLLPVDNFSVKWDGFIKIDRDGEYWFITESDDGVRLWIDGELVIYNWTDHTLEEDIVRIDLMKGWHIIRLEYYDSFQNATVKLFWEGEDRLKSIIPSDHLCWYISIKD